MHVREGVRLSAAYLRNSDLGGNLYRLSKQISIQEGFTVSIDVAQGLPVVSQTMNLLQSINNVKRSLRIFKNSDSLRLPTQHASLFTTSSTNIHCVCFQTKHQLL